MGKEETERERGLYLRLEPNSWPQVKILASPVPKTVCGLAKMSLKSTSDSALPSSSKLPTAVLDSTEMRIEPPLEWHVVDALYTKLRYVTYLESH